MIKELERLEALLPQAEVVKKGADFKASVERAGAAVDGASGLLERLKQLGDVTEPAKTFPGFTSEVVRRELKAIAEAGRSLERASEVQDFHDAPHKVQSAGAALGRAEEVMGVAWRKEIQRVFGPFQQLGATLSKIPESKEAGRALQAWAQQTLSIAQRPLPTSADVKEYAKATLEAAKRLKALEKLGIDDAVRRFLQVAASGEARLSDLEPSVLAWLRQNGSASQFSVRLG